MSSLVHRLTCCREVEREQVAQVKKKYHVRAGTGKQTDKDRIKGKGRRCCLGVRIFQCLAALAVFHLENLEE